MRRCKKIARCNPRSSAYLRQISPDLPGNVLEEIKNHPPEASEMVVAVITKKNDILKNSCQK